MVKHLYVFYCLNDLIHVRVDKYVGNDFHKILFYVQISICNSISSTWSATFRLVIVIGKRSTRLRTGLTIMFHIHSTEAIRHFIFISSDRLAMAWLRWPAIGWILGGGNKRRMKSNKPTTISVRSIHSFVVMNLPFGFHLPSVADTTTLLPPLYFRSH